MWLRLPLVSLASVIWGVSGCAAHSKSATRSGSTGQKSASINGAHTAVTQELELQSDSPLRLSFGAQGPIRVRLTDTDGAPLPDQQVSFALMGRGQDSSLAGLDRTTDADGVAENTLIAGQMAAAFRVRVSAPNALDTFVDAAVSDAGFGTLAVTAAYAGSRSVEQRLVFAQANMTCLQAASMSGDPSVTLSDKMDLARFLALPATVKYAVTALAEGMNGTVVAKGCTDGANVDADAETAISVSFTDEPLVLSGQFMFEAVLDASAPAAVLAATLRSAAQMLVQNDVNGQPVADAEGLFLLDSLDGTLRSDTYAKQAGVTGLANALSQARMAPASAGTLEHSLQVLLTGNGEGPLEAIPRIVELVQKSLATAHWFSALTLSASSKRPLSWQSQRIEALPIVDGASPPAVDLSAFADMTAISASFAPTQDAIELASLRVRAQLGSLAAQALTKVVSSDKPGHGEEISALVGCATLGQWLGKQSFANSAVCDASCVQAACDRAAARITGAGQMALLLLDDQRPTLTLQGVLRLGDDDGDLVPEKLSAAAFSGQWDPPSGEVQGDAVSGPANAVVLPSP
jgi:hypothetical protein